MHQTPMSQATQALNDLSGGDAAAADRLLPLVYFELRELAGRYFKRQPAGHTLQPTALVHEAFIKLVQQDDPSFDSRAHFLAVAAKAMRQILVDHARRKQTEKHGGHVDRIALEEHSAAVRDSDVDILALDEALQQLAEMDERKARVVELRFFGGLSMEETARALDVSRTTIADDWRIARAWIAKELGNNEH